MFHRFQPPIPVLGIIENMSYLDLGDGKQMDVFGAGGGEQLAVQTGTPFLGALPIDPEVRIGGDSGVPIVIAKPDSATAKVMKEITGKVASTLSVMAHG